MNKSWGGGRRGGVVRGEGARVSVFLTTNPNLKFFVGGGGGRRMLEDRGV